MGHGGLRVGIFSARRSAARLCTWATPLFGMVEVGAEVFGGHLINWEGANEDAGCTFIIVWSPMGPVPGEG